MPKRIKWTAASRKEKNWPVYVLRYGRRASPLSERMRHFVNDEFIPWAEGQFSGEFMTYLMDRDTEALIGIETERDAVLLRLWLRSGIKMTRLVAQQRNLNGYKQWKKTG